MASELQKAAVTCPRCQPGLSTRHSASRTYHHTGAQETLRAKDSTSHEKGDRDDPLRVASAGASEGGLTIHSDLLMPPCAKEWAAPGAYNPDLTQAGR